MNRIAFLGLFQALILVLIYSNVTAINSEDEAGPDAQNFYTKERINIPPVACNDTFIFTYDCKRFVSGNILLNDYDPNGDAFKLYFANTPTVGKFTISSDGNFSLELPEQFKGEITFEYYITEQTESAFKNVASVTIKAVPDCDCDQVPDERDIDNDNDGITNHDEGDGLIDTDNDLIPDSYDIDSDNDGITDNIEWQSEQYYITPLHKDDNQNGLDDAYDTLIGGVYYSPEDTNQDGIPDMLDADSDHDGISDFIEGFDLNHDGKADIVLCLSDQDHDGLDDAFDNVDCWSKIDNATGSKTPLPDSNQNGIRDWRDSSNESGLLYFVHPNPAKDQIRIVAPQIKINSPFKLNVYTLSGVLLLQSYSNSSIDQIDISDLSSGVYLLNIASEGFSGTQKLIISK